MQPRLRASRRARIVVAVAGSQNGEGWAAVFTNPAAESAVELRLRRRGWRTYLPLHRKLLRGIRIVGGRRVRVKGPGEIVLRPLFPRYIFAELWAGQPWHDLSATPGVARLVMRTRDAESPPALIDPDVIELIRASVNAGEFDDIRPKRDRADLRKLLADGQQPTVAINGHPLIGKLVGLDDNGRAQVLLTLLGREAITRVDAGPLQIIAAD